LIEYKEGNFDEGKFDGEYKGVEDVEPTFM